MQTKTVENAFIRRAVVDGSCGKDASVCFPAAIIIAVAKIIQRIFGFRRTERNESCLSLTIFPLSLVALLGESKRPTGAVSGRRAVARTGSSASPPSNSQLATRNFHNAPNTSVEPLTQITVVKAKANWRDSGRRIRLKMVLEIRLTADAITTIKAGSRT